MSIVQGFRTSSSWIHLWKSRRTKTPSWQNEGDVSVGSIATEVFLAFLVFSFGSSYFRLFHTVQSSFLSSVASLLLCTRMRGGVVIVLPLIRFGFDHFVYCTLSSNHPPHRFTAFPFLRPLLSSSLLLRLDLLLRLALAFSVLVRLRQLRLRARVCAWKKSQCTFINIIVLDKKKLSTKSYYGEIAGGYLRCVRRKRRGTLCDGGDVQACTLSISQSST